MIERAPRYSMDEFARRGEELFDCEIREKVEGQDPSKFLAIDIESGDFEVDANELAATDRLFERRPDAQIWVRRVGSKHAHRFGAGFPGARGNP